LTGMLLPQNPRWVTVSSTGKRLSNRNTAFETHKLGSRHLSSNNSSWEIRVGRGLPTRSPALRRIARQTPGKCMCIYIYIYIFIYNIYIYIVSIIMVILCFVKFDMYMYACMSMKFTSHTMSSREQMTNTSWLATCAREFAKGGLAKGGLAIYALNTSQVAKPPFTKPPFVNSRCERQTRGA